MINDFNIKKLKTMQGLEGYVISCELYYKKIKVGDFFDNGDGSQYNFYPYQNEAKVNEFLKQFPKIGSGIFSINWDVGILVEELINQGEAKKLLKKALKKGCSSLLLVEAYQNESPVSFYLSVYKNYDNEKLEALAKDQCKKLYPLWTFDKVHIYREEKDIDYTLNLVYEP